MRSNKMRTTVKEYQQKTEYKHDLQRLIRIGTDLVRCGDNTKVTDSVLLQNELELSKLKGSYFNLLDTVIVEYWIGFRKYADKVIKIGKTYFLNGRKMTKSNGYNTIIEVDSITDTMRKDMLADSYWY